VEVLAVLADMTTMKELREVIASAGHSTVLIDIVSSASDLAALADVLDSVAQVELLYQLEAACGLDAQEILDSRPRTIGDLKSIAESRLGPRE